MPPPPTQTQALTLSLTRQCPCLSYLLHMATENIITSAEENICSNAAFWSAWCRIHLLLPCSALTSFQCFCRYRPDSRGRARGVRYIDKPYRLSIYRHVLKISITIRSLLKISISIKTFVEISISISISIRTFLKISISLSISISISIRSF